jgi:integrase
MSKIPKVRIARPKERPFQIRYTCPKSKKEVRISTGGRDEEQAERLKQEVEAKLVLGIDPAPQKQATTATGPDEPWEMFRERYSRLHVVMLRDRTSARDAESRLDIAERILRPRTVGEVATKATLERLQASLLSGAGLEDTKKQKPRSPFTVKSYMAVVVAALNWSLGRVPKFDKVKTAKLKAMKGRPITVEEFERMLDAVPRIVGEDAAESWRHIMRGAWESGLRLEELMVLSWDDHSMIVPSWSHGPNPVLVLPADLQKNNTEESIPMLPGFEAVLKATPMDDRCGWVFDPVSLNLKFGRTARHGRPTGAWVGKVISRIGEAARVVVEPENKRRKKPAKFASAHDLRRSLAERMSEAGMPPELLQLIMRHSSIETTRRYYLSQNVQRDAAQIRSLLLNRTQVQQGPTEFAEST